ncbi:hypothetical protein FRC12_014856 [Ceratobasidium sp. 428]|nr:hypothetical protein FRC12_014856 [Ceratobasidium sp. 428]
MQTGSPRLGCGSLSAIASPNICPGLPSGLSPHTRPCEPCPPRWVWQSPATFVSNSLTHVSVTCPSDHKQLLPIGVASALKHSCDSALPPGSKIPSDSVEGLILASVTAREFRPHMWLLVLDFDVCHCTIDFLDPLSDLIASLFGFSLPHSTDTPTFVLTTLLARPRPALDSRALPARVLLVPSQSYRASAVLPMMSSA